ncbi:MAG TPA: hypothetical protein VHL79_22975 [Ramlibacter sp.]|jgi:hypothetical protein|nr:hypothetical protein [Ramlibacter sp.]
MKRPSLCVLALCALLPFAALADPDKDESGHGKHRKHGKHHAEFKQEYWEGNCKVERKREKNGDYKEERKCKGQRHAHEDKRRREHDRTSHAQAPRPVYVVPAQPVVVQPAPVVVQPGVTIHLPLR